MLDSINLMTEIPKAEYKQEVRELKRRLAMLQQTVREKKLPVVILFEGWGAAGKGSIISDVMLSMDPRGYSVYSITEPSQDELRKPLLWRYWMKLPEYGQFTIFDRSWYQDIMIAPLEENIRKSEVARRVHSINTFERQLADDGYVVLKFFLHIGQKEQEKRLRKLEENKTTRWRVTERDWKRNKQYERYWTAYDHYLQETDTACAPWHLIDAHHERCALLSVYQILVTSVETALQNREDGVMPWVQPCTAAKPYESPLGFPMVSMPNLAEVHLDKRMEEADYKAELKKAQKTLAKLHNKLYLSKRPLIIAYEGWYAAGKGGNIRRVAAALDPRGYEVIPVAAPDKTELAHHYLWRFWKNLPRTGHVAIFDRTWYGRVLVERIEGFCREDDWKRAYQEINEFEKELHDWGAILVKFWLHVDQDEQLARFMDRQNTPEKRWKITEEDWRNREKWSAYEIAVNDMFQMTSTEFAPWHIIESNDKRYGRIKALKTIIHAVESELAQ